MPSPASPAQPLQIGEVAERAGLSLRTVPSHDEMGLIIPEKRTDGGFVLSTDEHVARPGLIKQQDPGAAELRRASRNPRASAGKH